MPPSLPSKPPWGSARPQAWRLGCVTVLIILGRIGLFVCGTRLLLGFDLALELPLMRLLTGLVGSALLVALAGFLVRDSSVLFQVGLQSLAASGVASGGLSIYGSLREDGHGVLGSHGAVGVASLVLGMAAAVLIRRHRRLFRPLPVRQRQRGDTE